MKVLVANPGSSTIKLSLWDGAEPLETANILLHDRPELLDQALSDYFSSLSGNLPNAAGVRVVHGGVLFREPVLFQDQILTDLETIRPLSPLHTEVAIRTIRSLSRRFSSRPIVLSFDTAFHNTLLPEVFRYGIPESWYQDYGVRRYGFHGLSYDYIAHRLKELFPSEAIERTVALHLGSGASACAIRSGVSVDTTMGLTPVEGLMMGTRSGSIDPGISFYLESMGMTSREIEHDLNHRSGLLGVSGLDSDLLKLEEASDAGNDRAILAIAMFARRAAQSVAQMATSLGGISCLVFSGGIGEHSSRMRTLIAGYLGFLGVILDSRKNEEMPSVPVLSHLQQDRTDHEGYDRVLSRDDSPVLVVRISTREDWTIVRNTHLILRDLDGFTERRE